MVNSISWITHRERCYKFNHKQQQIIKRVKFSDWRDFKYVGLFCTENEILTQLVYGNSLKEESLRGGDPEALKKRRKSCVLACFVLYELRLLRKWDHFPSRKVLISLTEQFTHNDFSLNLARAFINLVNLSVTHQLFDRVF